MLTLCNYASKFNSIIQSWSEHTAGHDEIDAIRNFPRISRRDDEAVKNTWATEQASANSDILTIDAEKFVKLDGEDLRDFLKNAFQKNEILLYTRLE